MSKRYRKTLERDDLTSDLLKASPTTSTIAKIMEVIRTRRPTDEQLRILASRQNIERATRRYWSECGDENPVVLQLDKQFKKRFVFQWHITSVPMYLGYTTRNYNGFRAVLTDLYLRRPCTYDRPWRFVLGFDEFTAGAVLRQDNKRKAWSFMMGIRDLGPSVLQHLGAWIPIATLRSSVSKRVRGGFSNVGGNLLRRLGALREGFPLDLDGGQVLVFLIYDGPVADGAAIQYLLHIKGAAGLQPCFNCLNVVGLEEDENDDTMLAHDETHSLVDITENDTSKFVHASFEARCLQADVLATLQGTAGTAPDELDEVEKSFGLTHNNHGILRMNDLRPTLGQTIVRVDPMHSVYGHGIAETELSFLMQELEELPTPILFEDFDAIARAAWKSPTGTHAILPGIFSEHRRNNWRRTNTFSCGASEMISLIPVVLYLLESIASVQESLPLQLASWRALEFVSRLIARGKHGIGRGAELAAAIYAHGVAFAAAYGEMYDKKVAYKPKFHWTKHTPDNLDHDGFILDTFVTERGNIIFKKGADPIKNTGGDFEKSSLERTWHQAFGYLKHVVMDGLKDGEPCPELGDGCYISLQAIVMGTHIFDGTIIFLGPNAVFIIDAFLQTPAGLCFAGRHCDWLAPKGSVAAYWRPQLEIAIIPKPHRFLLAPMWCFEARGVLIFYA